MFNEFVEMAKKYRYEPFDFERAKAGEPVCTQDGRDAKIICCNMANKFYPLAAFVEIEQEYRDANGLPVFAEVADSFSRNGNAYHSEEYCLIMKVEIQEPKEE